MPFTRDPLRPSWRPSPSTPESTSYFAITTLEERPAVPRVRRGQLPAAVANGADRGHRVVEDHRFLADRPRFDQVGEPLARDPPDAGSRRDTAPARGSPARPPTRPATPSSAAPGHRFEQPEAPAARSSTATKMNWSYRRARAVVSGTSWAAPLPNEGIHLVEHPSAFGLD